MKERLKNNWGLKILAFFIAVMLWFIVVNIDNPIKQEVYRNIPVTVINTEVLAQEQQTFQIVDNTQTVSVTVTAYRSVLQKIEAEDIIAVADMKELTLKTQIPIDVTVTGHKVESVEANPRNLQIKLENEEIKKFPVVPTTTGTVRDGYALGEIEAVPEKVTVRGPESVINQISRVEASVSVSGLSKSQVLPSELVLYDKNNEEIDQTLLTNNVGADGVSVSVEILHTENIPLEFDVSRIEAAAGYEFTGITYQPMEVLLAGEKYVLKNLEKIVIPAEALAMSEVTDRTEKVVDISEYLPKDVQLLDENAGSVVVTVNVERNGTKTYDVTAASIVINNLDSNLRLNYKTADALVIKMRGSEVLLDSFEAEKRVSIDLKEYDTPGEYKVPVQVDIPIGCVLEEEVFVEIELVEAE